MTQPVITLLPCPFCGRSDLTTTTKPTWNEWRGFIACDTCGAMGPGVSSDTSGAEALAVTLWNRRGQ